MHIMYVFPLAHFSILPVLYAGRNLLETTFLQVYEHGKILITYLVKLDVYRYIVPRILERGGWGPLKLSNITE